MTYHAPMPAEEARFWAFVRDRQEVWFRKEVLRLPRAEWTGDEVLSNAKFTNVYRELDRGTRFVVEEVLERPEHEEVWQLVAHAFTYRWFGDIGTYQELRPFVTSAAYGSDDDLCAIGALLELRVQGHKRVFTGAYISGVPDMGTGVKSCDYMMVLAGLYDRVSNLETHMLDEASTLQTFYDSVLQLRGFGQFKAYQCCLDTLYPLARLGGGTLAPHLDVNSWTQAGPGCRKGLELLGVKGSDAALNRAMKGLRDKSNDVLWSMGFKFVRTAAGVEVPLTLSNVENCLCEFQKYRRMQEGGHVKTVYQRPGDNVWKPKYVTLPAWGW